MKGDPDICGPEPNDVALKHLGRQGYGLKGTAALDTAVLAGMGMDACLESAQKVVGRIHGLWGIDHHFSPVGHFFNPNDTS